MSTDPLRARLDWLEAEARYWRLVALCLAPTERNGWHQSLGIPPHRDTGSCPHPDNGWESRSPDCPACEALLALDAEEVTR